jgi:citrate synthase
MGIDAATSNRNATLEMEVPRGLKGVPVADTRIGDVLGMQGLFHYRGTNAAELARRVGFEDTWALLWDGALPSVSERERLMRAAGEARVAAFDALAPVARELVAHAADAQPLALLQTLLATFGAARGLRPWIDLAPERQHADAVAVAAAFPVAVALSHRLRSGAEPMAPDPTLGTAADYLRMCLGEVAPTQHVRALEQYLVLTMDHGFNASTFTARVVASTGADVGSAMVAALASLSGPLHGGAPARALAMVDEIGTAERAEPWLREHIERGERLMGFGHPVYVTDDPRSALLAEVAQHLGGPEVELARHVERTAVRLLDEYKPGRGLRTNVEFYAALVMRSAGLPDALFTPTFAVSRSIGWGAHILEQISTDNRIYRPSARYVGATPRPTSV